MESATQGGARRRKAGGPRRQKKRAWYSYTQACQKAEAQFQELQQQAQALLGENEGLRQLEQVLSAMVLESSDTLHHVGALAFSTRDTGGSASLLDTLCLDMEVAQALQSLDKPLQLPAGLTSNSSNSNGATAAGSTEQQLYTAHCLWATAHTSLADEIAAAEPEQLVQLLRQHVLQLVRCLESGCCETEVLEALVDRYVQLHLLTLAAGTAGDAAGAKLCSTNLHTLELQEAPAEHWQLAAEQLQPQLQPEQAEQLRCAYQVYDAKRKILQAELCSLAVQLNEHINGPQPLLEDPAATPPGPAPAPAADAAAEDVSASPCRSPALQPISSSSNSYWGCSKPAASPTTSTAVNNLGYRQLMRCSNGSSNLNGSSGCVGSAGCSGPSSPSISGCAANTGNSFQEYMVKPEKELLHELSQHLMLHVVSSPHTQNNCCTTPAAPDAAPAAENSTQAAPHAAVVVAADAPNTCAADAGTPCFSLAGLWDEPYCQKEAWEVCDRMSEVADRLQKQLKLCKQLEHRMDLLWLNVLDPRQQAEAARLSYPYICQPAHICQHMC